MAKARLRTAGRKGGAHGNAPSATEIIEDEYGNYRIRAGRLNGNFVAQAFPKSQSKSQELMAETSGSSEVEAIEALKLILEARERKRTAARRWDERSELSVPSMDEYIEALQQTNFSAMQLAMIKAQALAGEAGLTDVGLMSAAGYKSSDVAAKALAKAGGLMAHFLGIELPEGTAEKSSDARCVLGFQSADSKDERLIWVMHEELRHAVRATL